jgi:prepilin-type N-terminal cleavage/methylation domain-containing protein
VSARGRRARSANVEERIMIRAARSGESGFSLIELTVAMVVTLIVTGAIYGLLAGGQSAFRREPELSDRQQNVRVAMDMIMRDISNAGSGLPEWVQVFTRNLDGPTATPLQYGLNGAYADELEMITNGQGHDNEPVCYQSGTNNASNIRLTRLTVGGATPIANQTAVIIFQDGTWTMRYITGAASNSTMVVGELNCVSGSNTLLSFAPGVTDKAGMNNASGSTCQANAGAGTGTPPMGTANTGTLGCTGAGTGVCCQAAEVSFAQLVRYRIRNNGTVPELQRWDSSNPGYQTVARGIEDLQVQYTQADGTVSSGAPAVTRPNYTSLITQVTVTLSSRSEARNIQGATADANLGTFIRGSLTWTGSPRSALLSVAKQGGVAALWR